MGGSSLVARIITSALSAVMVIGLMLSQSATVAAVNGHKGQRPDVSTAVGPWVMTENLNDLPYIPTNPESDAVRLTNHPKEAAGAEEAEDQDSPQYPDFSRQIPIGLGNANQPLDIPNPLSTFPGMTMNLGCGNCLPPDTQGDVGPNHYIQSVNSSIRIHDKAGNVLAGPITYNSFFSPMGTATPCGSNQNQGDGQAMYDHISDRWIVTDFAFPAFPGTSFYQCIGVSRTADPVAGGWYLYAVQVDPGNTNFLGDYPKMALWPDAYYLSVNMFSTNTTFNGVRVYALNRAAMVNGGAANTIAFTITPANLGDQYSLLPATFRFGDPPPAGRDEWFMDVNSSAVAGTVETQVFVRRFHPDFVTPANSYFGVGATHAPDGTITVNGFKDAFNATSNIVPNGTVTATNWLDTLGDKLMFPLVYQNRGGVESVYASQTVLLASDATLTGPTAVRWYQFNMTGNTIPSTPAQQQDFNNGNDGLFRWMPSLNVDVQGNMAIGYSASSTTVDPGIRYAGRLAGDPLNTLAQGEAVLAPGTGHQSFNPGRWGDYSATFVDPSNGCVFYHTNEYYSVTGATGAAPWNTRIGRFRMPGCVDSPLTPPSQSPGAGVCPTITPGSAPVSTAPVTVVATAGTTGPTDYATLKAAFDAINAGTHQGQITIWLLGDTTEAATAALNGDGIGSASYTGALVVPSGARTVSGSLAAPLIDLNGADCVTVDGRNASGNSLTISNTDAGNTVGTSTIRFTSDTAAANGAQNNTIKNSTILGSSTTGLQVAGGTIVFNTTTANATNLVGNSNNTISNNNIGPAGANLPNKAIFGLGTSTNNNTVNRDNVIDGNNIYDFFNAASSVSGIHVLGGNTNWTISNNKIYQTAARTFTGPTLRYAGITLNTPTAAGTVLGWFTVVGNTIGFGAANGTGTTTISGLDNEFRGIDAPSTNVATNGTADLIKNNVISGINQTTSRSSTTSTSAGFIGIVFGTINGVANILNNQIGSTDGSSSIVVNATSITAGTAPVMGIHDFSSRSDQVNSNQIGNITINSGGSGTTTGFRGILANTLTAPTETINNNVITDVTDNIVGSYAVEGIQVLTSAATITGNTIKNLTGNSNSAGALVGAGIVVSNGTSTSNVTSVSGNTVYSLSNNSGSAGNSINAIDLTLATSTNVTGNLIERNFIHSISLTSTDNTSQIAGIVLRGPATGTATSTIQNNMIRLGVDSAGNSITAGLQISGIRDIAATGTGVQRNSYYFNSVYVGGTGVASSSNTFAFDSGSVTSTRSFRDNIFMNARSNASGTGKNYAITVAGTAPNPPGLTMNNNDLVATGTGGFVGLFNGADDTTLADWQTATGQDANSLSADPLFLAPNGTASTVNLHLSSLSPVIGQGASVTTTLASPLSGIGDDFDGDLRANPPVIGADELSGTVLVSIAVTPVNPSVDVTSTQQFTATGTYANGATQDLTNSVTWSSSNTGVATISNVSGTRGLATPVATGQTTIRATDGATAIYGETMLTVTKTITSIAVTPANPSVAKGLTQQFTATATYSDASQSDVTASVTWSSSNTGVATIDGTGLATTLATGQTTIGALDVSTAVSGSTVLTVTPAVIASISVTPVNPSVAKGRTQQFSATATYTDNTQGPVTNQVTWSSSNTGVATISSSGLASTLATGPTTIRATDPATAVYGETTLTVTPPVLDSIAVTPSNPSILTGGSQQFTATGSYSDASTQNLTSSVTWTSSNTSVATINSLGLASGLAQGTTTITATDPGSGVHGATILTVSNTPPPPPDTTPPVVSNVTTILREGGHIGSVSVVVSWSASDDVTPTSSLVFEVQRRRFRMRGPTAWQTVATVTGQTFLYQLPLWHRYQYRVRGMDQAGHWGAYAEALPVTFIRRDERSFVRDASWTITPVPGAMRGRVARSSTPGGTASLTFTGNGVAVVATTGAGQGTLQACIDPGTASQNCRTIDLSTLPAGKKQLPLVFTLPWATHTLRITVVSGTVDLDGGIFSR